MDEPNDNTTQEVATASVTAADSGSQETAQVNERDYDAEIKKLRAEAAKYRNERNEWKDKAAALEPAAKQLAEIEEAKKSEDQKLRERLEQLEAAKTKAEAEAARMKAQNKLIVLAGKAGVDPDIALLLDLSKFDLDNEEAAVEILQKLAPKSATRAAGGNSVNPSSSPAKETDADKRYRLLNPAGKNADAPFWG